MHAGDATFRGDVREITMFSKWFNEQPFKNKIFVPGNHDWLFQTNEKMAREIMGPDVIVLIDQALDLNGIKIYGSPWQPWFYDWAFNLPRGEELKKKWDLIPHGTDVLITHGPPYMLRDSIEDRHVGCVDLGKRVLEIKPKYHVFGHIHWSYGETTFHETTYINASICNEEYQALNKPIVFDI